MGLKIKFSEYLIDFRNTRRVITDSKEMLTFSDSYGLGFTEKDLPAAIYTYGFAKNNKDNSAWLIRQKDGLYTADICNDEPASFLLSDVEYELADYYYGEEYYYELKYSKEQIDYLRKVQDTIRKFNSLYNELNELWQNDPEGLDMHSFLEEDYPFSASFDEIDFCGWKDTVEGKIEKAVTELK